MSFGDKVMDIVCGGNVCSRSTSVVFQSVARHWLMNTTPTYVLYDEYNTLSWLQDNMDYGRKIQCCEDMT
jgi:hypothetical protein